MSAPPGWDWAVERGRLLDAQLGVFGKPVLYCKPPADPFTVLAILEALQSPDSMTIETGLGQEFAPGGRYRRIYVRVTDLTAPPEDGDEVQIDALSYRVIHVEANDFDGAHLTLHLP